MHLEINLKNQKGAKLLRLNVQSFCTDSLTAIVLGVILCSLLDRSSQLLAVFYLENECPACYWR